MAKEESVRRSRRSSVRDLCGRSTCTVEGSGIAVSDGGPGSQGFGFRVEGLGFRVQGVGSRVQGRVQRFRVRGYKVSEWRVEDF